MIWCGVEVEPQLSERATRPPYSSLRGRVALSSCTTVGSEFPPTNELQADIKHHDNRV